MTTNATVLADALVEAGIADKLTLPEPHSGTAYQFPTGETDDGWLFLTEESLITDWRVAGKVLESMPGARVPNLFKDIHLISKDRGQLPRAIIEAWYGARQ